MAKTKKRDKITTPLQDAESVRQQAAEVATAPQSAGDTTAAAPDRERIAARAYELYRARGEAEGQELDDWLAAEQELTRKGGPSSD